MFSVLRNPFPLHGRAYSVCFTLDLYLELIRVWRKIRIPFQVCTRTHTHTHYYPAPFDEPFSPSALPPIPPHTHTFPGVAGRSPGHGLWTGGASRSVVIRDSPRGQGGLRRRPSPTGPAATPAKQVCGAVAVTCPAGADSGSGGLSRG